jgi:hypothetical protein
VGSAEAGVVFYHSASTFAWELSFCLFSSSYISFMEALLDICLLLLSMRLHFRCKNIMTVNDDTGGGRRRED